MASIKARRSRDSQLQVTIIKIMKIIKNDNDIYDNNIVFIIKEIIKDRNLLLNRLAKMNI